MIGNVETLQPEQPATVSTDVDPEGNILYFNFGIPKGSKGDTGEVDYGSMSVVNGKLVSSIGGETNVIGTVAMVPKGEYDEETNYDVLNTVLYNDSTYMAIQPSTGVSPTDTDYWQLIGGGLTRDDIVDNLNSNDATKMLSAKQGKVIDSKLEGKTSYFNSVVAMKAGGLKAGNLVETKGYYTSNDGGGAKYEIVDDNTLTEDGAYIHELSNGLFARMIIENDTINFKQLGAKPNDDTYDNHQHYVQFENICNLLNKKLTLYIPAGTWYSSETQFTRIGGLQIVGCTKCIISKGNGAENTILKNISNSQEYYFKIGNNSNETTIPLANLMTGYYLDSLTIQGSYNNAAIVILGCEWSKIGHLFFRMIKKGHCLNISSSWEWDVDYLEFRVIESLDSAIYYSDVYTIPGVVPNCSAWYFNYLNFENMNCSAIETSTKANFVHNEFNVIEYERSFASGGAVSSLPEGVTLDDTFKTYLFKGWFDKTTINSINHNNRGTIYVNAGTQENPNWITYLALFSDDIIDTIHEDSAYNNFHISVANIILTGGGASYIVSSHYAERTSQLVIGTVCFRDAGESVYNGDGVTGLALLIGTINQPTLIRNQHALNCLMDKMVTSAKSTGTAPKALELLTVSDAFDISGCCLVARYSAPIPCDGVKKINLTVKLVTLEDGTDTAGNMRFAYKNKSDNSYTYIANRSLTAGLNRITIDLSEINYPEQYLLHANSSAIHKLLIYSISYEY